MLETVVSVSAKFLGTRFDSRACPRDWKPAYSRSLPAAVSGQWKMGTSYVKGRHR